MREILFRGKTKESGEWVQGYFVYAKSDFDSEECREADIIPHNTDRVYKGEYNVVFPCIPETISEFTGICDKNGTKIFEGDIVKYRDTFHKVVFEQRNGTAYFGLVYNSLETLPFGHYQDLKQIEVIGNIHDNPELLEGEE